MRQESQVECWGLLGPLVMYWTYALQFHFLHDLMWRKKKLEKLFTALLSLLITHQGREMPREDSQEEDTKIHFRLTYTLSRNPLISAVNNVLFSAPFMLCGPFSLLCTLPSSLTRLSRRQWETFLPRSSSLSQCFVQLALLTGSPVEEKQRRGGSLKTLCQSLVEGRRARGNFRNELRRVWDWAHFNSPGFMWGKRWCSSHATAVEPPPVLSELVQSGLVSVGGEVGCVIRVIRIAGQYSGRQSAGNSK